MYLKPTFVGKKRLANSPSRKITSSAFNINIQLPYKFANSNNAIKLMIRHQQWIVDGIIQVPTFTLNGMFFVINCENRKINAHRSKKILPFFFVL